MINKIFTIIVGLFLFDVCTPKINCITTMLTDPQGPGLMPAFLSHLWVSQPTVAWPFSPRWQRWRCYNKLRATTKVPLLFFHLQLLTTSFHPWYPSCWLPIAIFSIFRVLIFCLVAQNPILWKSQTDLSCVLSLKAWKQVSLWQLIKWY